MTTIASHQQAPSEQFDFFGIPDELQPKPKAGSTPKPPPLRIEVIWNGGISTLPPEEQPIAEPPTETAHAKEEQHEPKKVIASYWPNPKSDHFRSTLTFAADSDNVSNADASVSFDDLNVDIFDDGKHSLMSEAAGNDYSTEEYKTEEEFLAGLMLKRMKYDLNYAVKECDDPYDGKDFSGTTMVHTVQHDPRIRSRIDAVVWLYELHTDQPLLSASLCCALLYMDVEPIRRIVARNCRHAIEQTIALLADLMGKDYARQCAAKVSDYLAITL